MKRISRESEGTHKIYIPLSQSHKKQKTKKTLRDVYYINYTAFSAAHCVGVLCMYVEKFFLFSRSSRDRVVSEQFDRS